MITSTAYYPPATIAPSAFDLKPTFRLLCVECERWALYVYDGKSLCKNHFEELWMKK